MSGRANNYALIFTIPNLIHQSYWCQAYCFICVLGIPIEQLVSKKYQNTPWNSLPKNAQESIYKETKLEGDLVGKLVSSFQQLWHLLFLVIII